MIYFIAKAAQVSGLIIILISFVRSFPSLMSPKILLAGILVFVFGWVIERFLLKKA